MSAERNYETLLLRSDALRVLLLGSALVLFGTFGFRVLEDAPWLDSFYMTVITITTVGVGVVTSPSPMGKILIVTLVLAGVTLGYMTAAILGRAVLTNFVFRTRKRMHKVIDGLSDHVILCGYGRLGQIVREELEALGKKFVIIEIAKDTARLLAEEQLLHIHGDATEDEILLQAGVERCSGVIAAIGSDAGNVFITLTTKEYNATCPIVARAEDPNTEHKLLLVGATSVVTPYSLGGRRLAQAFLRPGAVDLADLALGGGNHEVLIEEVALPLHMPDAMATLKGLDLGQRFGLIAVAVRHSSDGSLHFNPRADEELRPNDHLMVMGKREHIDTCLQFLSDCG